MSNESSILWNNLLSLASIINVLILIWYILLPRLKNTFFFNSNEKNNHWTFWLYNNQHLLVTMFTIACAIRSIWPRQDGLRICFHDSPFSLVIIGRTLATFAELSYIAQLCAIIAKITKRTIYSDLWFNLNVVAQSCCWYSVITQDQRGHVIEESIWMLTILSMMIYLGCYYFFSKLNELSNNSIAFIKVFSFAGIIYVAFMCRVDIPMYYNRFVEDSQNSKVYQNFYEGSKEIMTCLKISSDDSIWLEEMPWMTGYFTLAVWSSMLMSSVKIK